MTPRTYTINLMMVVALARNITKPIFKSWKYLESILYYGAYPPLLAYSGKGD